MRPKEVSRLLDQTISADLPILLAGAPGVGKTSLVEQSCARIGHGLITCHLATADPTDGKGLPWIAEDKQSANFLPIGEVADAMRATTPTVLLLDDLGTAPASVQAAFMHLIAERRVGDTRLPSCVRILATTNRREDNAGVNGLLEPVKSRFASIVTVDAHTDDWSAWAIGAGMPVELIAFLRYKPDQLLAWKPTNRMENGPTPRTWAYLGRLFALGLPKESCHETYSGAVGEAAAAEFESFLALFGGLVTADAILAAPDSAPIPQNLSELYAVSTALASKATQTTFGRIARYAERMNDAGRGEFAALCLRDAARRNADTIGSWPDFTRAMCGPLGAIFREGQAD